MLELATRRIVHQNVTPHPTAEWTLQQFREALPGGHAYRYVIHDQDSIFSKQLDASVEQMGRECLDFVIPLNERHLLLTLNKWRVHYNRGRPHSSLGPGFPEPTQDTVPAGDNRHELPTGYRVEKTSVLGGLHHEYRLVKEAA